MLCSACFKCGKATIFLLGVLFPVLIIGSAEKKTIDSLQTLDSLTELALLKHHPKSLHINVTENATSRFVSLVHDLQSDHHLKEENKYFNCSSLPYIPHISEILCQNSGLNTCLSMDDMLQLVPQTTQTTSEILARLCPLLLLQLHSKTCTDPSPPPKAKTRPPSSAVWGYGLLFVTIISCCSLVGVVILPLLNKTIYHVVLMLFEGLAVGSLAGSSIFHLIPQTFHLVGQDVEHGYLWKSLIIFGGIYLFFLSERLMKIAADVKQKKKRRKLAFDTDENSTKLLCSLSGLSNGVSGSAQIMVKPNDFDKEILPNGGIDSNGLDKKGHQNGYTIANGNIHSNHIIDNYSSTGEDEIHHNHHHHEHPMPFEQGRSAIGTVAWMIIFGDGLHNFIDGLSIGAAFSQSILAGVSISVAVVCEEFPHELGDFAVLLSAGMTTRQALLYNFLSAITCYLGLVFGILLGDLAEGGPYIFALAAGMFLYISLVDMMGELNEALEQASQSGVGKQLKVFFIQNVGIILGVVILFVMARYSEHINFEGFGSFGISEEAIEDPVKAFYNGLQEAKHYSPLTG